MCVATKKHQQQSWAQAPVEYYVRFPRIDGTDPEWRHGGCWARDSDEADGDDEGSEVEKEVDAARTTVDGLSSSSSEARKDYLLKR